MQRSCAAVLSRRLRTQSFSSSTSGGGGNGKIVASVLFERLPVVVPKIDPTVYAFQEFSFRWRQQFRREYPEAFLKKSDARGKGEYQMEYEPAPRITEADKIMTEGMEPSNFLDKLTGNLFRKSLNRALDRRLYLLLRGTAHGSPDGEPCWHFPEKVHEAEDNLRSCAEFALKSVIGDLSHTYFVGNAPMGHLVTQPTESNPNLPPLKRFFFKSQVIAVNKFIIGKCDDFVWLTKDELLEFFPDHAEYLSKMIIS